MPVNAILQERGCSLLTGDRTMGNSLKLHQRKFRLDIKKSLLLERVIRH